MMDAEHRRPLAALLLVFAAACMIMGDGLRTQVVEVLVGAGAPRQLITAIAPDTVLGQSLINAPQAPQARPPAPREVPATSNGNGQEVESGAVAAPSAVQVDTRPANKPRPGRTGTKPDQAAGPVAPEDGATPEPAPVPEPEPTPVPGPRPGFQPTPTPLMPEDGSPDEGHYHCGHDEDHSDHGWGERGHHDRNDGRSDTGDADKSDPDKSRGDHRPHFQAPRTDRGNDRGDHHGSDRGDRGRGSDDRRGRGPSSRDSRQGSVSDRHDSRDHDSRGHYSRGQDGDDGGNSRSRSGHDH